VLNATIPKQRYACRLRHPSRALSAPALLQEWRVGASAKIRTPLANECDLPPGLLRKYHVFETLEFPRRLAPSTCHRPASWNDPDDRRTQKGSLTVYSISISGSGQSSCGVLSAASDLARVLVWGVRQEGVNLLHTLFLQHLDWRPRRCRNPPNIR
jgi:hypothetical protein